MKQIKTLKDLQKVVKLNKVLFCASRKRPSKVSACFLLEQSGKTLLRLFEKGLYIYEKNAKRRTNKAV